MSAIEDKLNAILGVIAAILSYIFGKHWFLFAAYLILNILDFVTRWFVARINGNESSSKCSIGIIKKIGYWIEILIGFGMSAVFIELGKIVGVNMHITSLIGWFVLGALTINEVRSVLENLAEAGVNVPKALINGLEVVNKSFDAAEKDTDQE